MARGGSVKERARREAKRSNAPASPGRLTRSRARTEAAATAAHEAGHAVAAHALGRRCVRLRARPRVLPVGHPENPHDTPLRSAGYHLSTPTHGEAVIAHQESGAPLDAELVTWCKQEAIIALAGPLSEGVTSGPEIQHDMAKFGHAASALGRLDTRGVSHGLVDANFQDAATEAAREIVTELKLTIDSVARRLVASGELNERMLGNLLSDATRGSHSHLLEKL